MAALALSLFVVTACEGDPVVPNTGHVGTYQLLSVNGEAVPMSYEDDGELVTISEGTLVLGANMTFAIEIDVSFTQDDETTSETITVSGSYTRSGSTVSFSHGGSDDGFSTATISGSLLTTTGGGGEVLVFERQD